MRAQEAGPAGDQDTFADQGHGNVGFQKRFAVAVIRRRRSRRSSNVSSMLVHAAAGTEAKLAGSGTEPIVGSVRGTTPVFQGIRAAPLWRDDRIPTKVASGSTAHDASATARLSGRQAQSACQSVSYRPAEELALRSTGV